MQSCQKNATAIGQLPLFYSEDQKAGHIPVRYKFPNKRRKICAATGKIIVSHGQAQGLMRISVFVRVEIIGTKM